MWDTYPDSYRQQEVGVITRAVRGGESVSIVGLSGAGKSNLMGFVANRIAEKDTRFVLVDCNRLSTLNSAALFRLMRRALDSTQDASDEFDALDVAIAQALRVVKRICFLFDRFDALAGVHDMTLFSNLRALRDAHKFSLSYVIATRHMLAANNELAELIHANVIYLGALSESDARWSIQRYAERHALNWNATVEDQLIAATRGYASLLRAACEAYQQGAPLTVAELSAHAAVRARVNEFWADEPLDEEVQRSGLKNLPLLGKSQTAASTSFDTTNLTAKEHALLSYLQTHANAVCEKDDIIRAVWSEDKVFERGIRDDSLAQLVRRLREKIEPDPANPRYVHTVAGRGYRMTH